MNFLPKKTTDLFKLGKFARFDFELQIVHLFVQTVNFLIKRIFIGTRTLDGVDDGSAIFDGTPDAGYLGQATIHWAELTNSQEHSDSLLDLDSGLHSVSNLVAH